MSIITGPSTHSVRGPD